MKRLFLVLCFLALPAAAQLGASTEVHVTSSNVLERAWRRDVVMTTPDGSIIGDGGRVASAAETTAIDTVASNATDIATSATNALHTALQDLYGHTNQMATAAQSFALVLPPENDRATLTGYVVDESTDGVTDTQWVWYNRVLSLKPTRWVAYEYYGGAATQKCEWVSWTSNGVSRTVNGTTWNGVHQCTVQRPTWARGVACLSERNDRLGGQSGFDFGDMLLTLNQGADTAFTGFITNSVATPKVEAYFDNGFLKSIKEINE